MTRLYFYAGRLRSKVILALLVSLFFGGVLDMAGFRSLLCLPREELYRQTILALALDAAVFTFLGLYAWVTLRSVAVLLCHVRDYGSPLNQEGARQTALCFPLFFTIATSGGNLLAITLGVIINVIFFRLKPGLAIGMALGAAAIAFVTCTFLYFFVRTVLRPITAHFRHEDVPDGIRISIRGKVALTFFFLALAASIPTAMVGLSRLRIAQHEVHARNQEHLAEVLAHGEPTSLRPESSPQVMAPVRSSGGGQNRLAASLERRTFTSPSQHGVNHLEAFFAASPRSDYAVLGGLVFFLVVLAGYIGWSLGGSISRDVVLVTGRIAAMAQADAEAEKKGISALVPCAPQFSDLQQLADGVNNLLVRMTEINMAHFIAVEKTLATDRVKMQFLANVSHDLRNPLNSILGFSELLLRDMSGQAKEGQRQQVEIIHRSGKDLLRLINEVLDSANLEAGRITLQREESLPAEIVNHTLMEIRRHKVHKGIQIETELQAGLPPIFVDSYRLCQALDYLICFCIESMDQGKVVIQVKTKSLGRMGRMGRKSLNESAASRKQQDGNVLQIRIADTSPGLARDELEQLFAGFRRRPRHRDLGLSLPLAKALIEMHEGKLHVQSDPGLGTTFFVDIPLPQRKVLARLRPNTTRC